MKALIQRVSEAKVTVRGLCCGEISRGLLVFLCVGRGDTEEDLNYILKKVSNLRVFDDPEGKMNLSVMDTGGEVLIISQFTLAARTRKGNRPSFDDAESPEEARRMVDSFARGLKEMGIKVQTGIFGEYMQVSLINDGPVTILIDSGERTRG